MQNDEDKREPSPRRSYERRTMGNPVYSLRSRREMVLAEYEPLAQRLRAGDLTAFTDFDRIADMLLGIEREIHGSQLGYFNRLDEVNELTKLAIERQSVGEALTRSGDPGRPALGYQLYQAEHDRRIKEGEALQSVKAEANHLRTWYVATHPNLPPPTAKTIENRIREKHRGPKN